jgi:hypothetical protein
MCYWKVAMEEAKRKFDSRLRNGDSSTNTQTNLCRPSLQQIINYLVHAISYWYIHFLQVRSHLIQKESVLKFMNS